MKKGFEEMNVLSEYVEVESVSRMVLGTGLSVKPACWLES